MTQIKIFTKEFIPDRSSNDPNEKMRLDMEEYLNSLDGRIITVNETSFVSAHPQGTGVYGSLVLSVYVEVTIPDPNDRMRA